MSLRRALHELWNENALYYQGDIHVQIQPWVSFGSLPESYAGKIDAAKAYLGKKWCMYNKKPKTVVERKRKKTWRVTK